MTLLHEEIFAWRIMYGQEWWTVWSHKSIFWSSCTELCGNWSYNHQTIPFASTWTMCFCQVNLMGALTLLMFFKCFFFYPRPVLAFGYCHRLRLCVCVCLCVCVSLCVNHLLIHAITRDTFKLGSPDLDQRCKRCRLRSLLFWGAIDLDLQGQI